MSLLRAVILCAIVALAMAPSAEATVIYDNGAPDLVTGLASDVDSPFSHETADSFVLQAGANVVTDIHWWGFYYNANPAFDTTSFRLTIFDNNGGNPGNVVWQTNAGIAQQDTGDNVSFNSNLNIYAYEYVLDAPLTLTPGQTYYLAVYADTTGTGDEYWNWATSDYQALRAHWEQEHDPFDSAWEIHVGDMAFRLTGVVPEPATLSLLGLGLFGLAARPISRRAR